MGSETANPVRGGAPRLARREFVRLAAGLLGVAAGGTLGAACSSAPAAPGGAGQAAAPGVTSSPKTGGSLTFAARQDILDTLDPQRTTQVTTRKVIGQMFDTLTVVKHDDQKLYPGLAESWTVSDDFKTYTFKLRSGVKFHDGTPFNAEAVKFSFDRIKEPEQLKGVAQGFLGPYQSSQVIDESTIKVIFE